jgi:3-deoxy-7-phosphoheptulonate synthase
LVEGRQNHTAGQKLSELTYGQSITDGCIGWEKTVEMLQFLSDAVIERRKRLDDDLNS